MLREVSCSERDTPIDFCMMHQPPLVESIEYGIIRLNGGVTLWLTGALVCSMEAFSLSLALCAALPNSIRRGVKCRTFSVVLETINIALASSPLMMAVTL